MEKIKLLLYCTKQRPYLIKNYDGKYISLNNLIAWDSELNGKIVAECDFEVEAIRGEIKVYSICDCGWISPSKHDWCFDKDLLNKSRLTNDQMCDYLDGNTGYAIHIKNLNIFDDPRVISYYFNENEEYIEKAPQNMRTCYEYKYSGFETDIPISSKKYILISIRAEWLCKILNGEKTIEIRKKVLKEMM